VEEREGTEGAREKGSCWPTRAKNEKRKRDRAVKGDFQQVPPMSSGKQPVIKERK